MSSFEELYALGEQDSSLAEARRSALQQPIQDWRSKDAQRRTAEESKRLAERAKTIADFEKDRVEILSGQHLNWLTFIGRVYFAQFSDLDRSATPRERLEKVLGAANVAAAIEGLKAILSRKDLPTVQDVATAAAKNSYPLRWYSVIAGMDEAWVDTPHVDAFSQELLATQIALDLVMPTYSRRGNTELEDTHLWKAALLEQESELVASVYLQVAREGLRLGRENVTGIYELLNNKAFVHFRGNACLALLSECPKPQPFYLELLLGTVLAAPSARPTLLDLARIRSTSSGDLTRKQRRLWLAAGYLVSPQEFQERFEKEARSVEEVVWELRALTGHDRLADKTGKVPLQASQLALIIEICAMHFAAAEHPTGGWGGDQNPWDASQFVRLLIDELSAERSDSATEALRRLQHNIAISSYADAIKHALAAQRILLRQSNYDQPGWEATIAALSNHAPANAADLQALLHSHLTDLCNEIRGRSNDVYKQFWNEDTRGRVVSPKSEESCRDVLLGMLRNRLQSLGVVVEPEGHMVADKRVDISVALAGRKSLIELKRESHPEVWRAYETQLERFYAIDPDANGYGTYGVFWFGGSSRAKVRRRPDKGPTPQSASEMEDVLNCMIEKAQRPKLKAVVIDVSVPYADETREAKREPSIKRAKTVRGASDRKANCKTVSQRKRSTERRTTRGASRKRLKRR